MASRGASRLAPARRTGPGSGPAGRVPRAPAARLSVRAARQSGLFTREQARACGFSAGQIQRRVRDGEWQQVLGQVLMAVGLPPTACLRDVAAQLAVRGSVLAGPSAARRHGLAVPDPRCYLAVGPGRRARLPGVRLLRDPLAPSDVVVVDGLLVTGRARTVFDCLRVLPDTDAIDLLERELRAGWVSGPELAERVHLFAGRRGAKRLAGLSRLAGSWERAAGAGAAVELLRRAGFTGWRTGAEIEDGRGLVGVGAVVFDGARIVVEIDGYTDDVFPARLASDRERHNRLAAAGWRVLRLTGHDLARRPEHAVAVLRAALAGGSMSSTSGPVAANAPAGARGAA